LKIDAIFSDYDGTLAPFDVRPEASRVSEGIRDPLLRLSSLVPVAIVTSKDSGFVRPRTTFSRAWACVSGLEIILASGRKLPTRRISGRLHEGLDHAKREGGAGLTFELKHSSTGGLLGFSVHWRGRATPTRFLETVPAELEGMGLTVVHDPSWPFLDVFGARPDKGRAVRKLKALLNVKGNALYLGDSSADNPAFEAAEVGICVEHGQGVGELECSFAVRFEELGGFLSSLADHDLSLDLGALTRKVVQAENPAGGGPDPETTQGLK
jgi:hypothetical protein